METSAAALALLLAASPIFATGFTTGVTHELELRMIEDCLDNAEPHGFYGAFFQRCEFTFRKSKTDATLQVPTSIMMPDGVVSGVPALMGQHGGSSNACSDERSTVVGRPEPTNWVVDLKDSSDSWDSFSSDDLPDVEEIADKLMLFPDMCLAVSPRCHPVDHPMLQDRLPLYFDEIPAGSTHVEVNCQGDAMELSRFVHDAADDFEKSTPTIIVWMVAVVLFSLVMSLWACHGCVRVVRSMMVPAVTGPIRVSHPAHDKYMSLAGDYAYEMPELDLSEKDELVKK